MVKGAGPRGPYHLEFDGLMAIIRSKARPTAALRRMLVSHTFVELFHIIETDKSFSQPLFDTLSESERDFMRFALKKCKVPAREFDAAYNRMMSHHISRLQMLQDAVKIGNDSPDIKKQMREILELLYSKNMFSTSYYGHLKRAFSA